MPSLVLRMDFGWQVILLSFTLSLGADSSPVVAKKEEEKEDEEATCACSREKTRQDETAAAVLHQTLLYRPENEKGRIRYKTLFCTIQSLMCHAVLYDPAKQKKERVTVGAPCKSQ